MSKLQFLIQKIEISGIYGFKFIVMKKSIVKIMFVFVALLLLLASQYSVTASILPKKCTDHLENWFCYEGSCMTNTDTSWCDQ